MARQYGHYTTVIRPPLDVRHLSGFHREVVLLPAQIRALGGGEREELRRRSVDRMLSTVVMASSCVNSQAI
jgi:hypothetical protein